MAKSSFWDDLGNTLTRKAKGLSSRAENLYEIQKIRNKLSAQERMTEKLMMDIDVYKRQLHMLIDVFVIAASYALAWLIRFQGIFEHSAVQSKTVQERCV